MYMTFLALIIFSIVGCSPSRNQGTESTDSKIAECSPIYEDVFINTYYDFARSNNDCQGCHGSGVGPQFAVLDNEQSFVNFYINGPEASFENKVLSAKQNFYDNATIEPGHNGAGRTSHINTLDTYESEWTRAKNDFSDCID